MDYYQEQNIIKTVEHLFPSGKFKLTIHTYNTKAISGKSTWEYTQGIVTSMDNNQVVGFIKRNYSQFPYLFFIQNEVEYLVSGRSYMSQTIINCHTGEVYDNTDDPERADYCWADIIQLDNNTVAVNGCVWGGGYKYTFYDFTNISKGWPQLNVTKEVVRYLDIDYFGYTAQVHDGIMNILQWNNDDEDIFEEDEDTYNIDYIKQHCHINLHVKREADEIVLVSIVLSELQQKRDEEQALRKKKELKDYEQMKNDFYYDLVEQLSKFKWRELIGFNRFYMYVNHSKAKWCHIEYKNEDATISLSCNHNRDYKVHQFSKNVTIIYQFIKDFFETD